MEIDRIDGILSPAGGQERRLVQQVCEIGAGKTGGGGGDGPQIHARSEVDAAGVDAQDRLATADVRAIHENLPIESARPQQSGIQCLRAVCGRHQNHALPRIEAIHFGQELVQRLFALLVGNQRAPPGSAERIELVNEDDAGRAGLRLSKEIPHPGRTHAYEHLDELRAGEGKKRHLRFAGHSSSEESFPRARRANEQHTLRNASSETCEARRVLQKLHDFAELFFRLVHTRNIGKRHADIFGSDELGPRPTKAERGRAWYRNPQEKGPRDEHNHQRQNPVEKEIGEPAFPRLPRKRDLVLIEKRYEARIVYALGHVRASPDT